MHRLCVDSPDCADLTAQVFAVFLPRGLRPPWNPRQGSFMEREPMLPYEYDAAL